MCVNGITVYADARSYITECEINDALHFGVDNLTLWQPRRSAATAL